MNIYIYIYIVVLLYKRSAPSTDIIDPACCCSLSVTRRTKANEGPRIDRQRKTKQLQ